MERIKASRVLAGALFILLGLSFGVGLNLRHVGSSVIGATVPSPTTGGINVVDDVGRIVGQYVESDGWGPSVMRRIHGFVFPLPINGSGFSNAFGISVYFTNLNCTGTGYIAGSLQEFVDANLPLVIPQGESLFGTAQGTLIYGGGPSQMVSVQSIGNSLQTTIPDNCGNFPEPQLMALNPVVSFDLSTLGLVPPFDLNIQ
jgi:hypothetical protein